MCGLVQVLLKAGILVRAVWSNKSCLSNQIVRWCIKCEQNVTFVLGTLTTLY